jgi:acyl carrier protein
LDPEPILERLRAVMAELVTELEADEIRFESRLVEDLDSIDAVDLRRLRTVGDVAPRQLARQR